jgi:NAD(P)-dependent dehydrogenase (short-subunit alcohol dehydrogenase family)
VFAACRHPSAAGETAALARGAPDRVRVLPLDVADPASIAAAARQVAAATDRLDLLVNAAGVYSGRGSADPQASGEALGRLDMAPALDVLRTNAVGPLLVAQSLLGLLRRSPAARVVSLSSGYGSVSANTSGFPYYYAASKAALNMSMRSFAADTAGDGIITVLLDPGWVRTDMGGRHAPISAADSVAAMLRVIGSLDRRHNGSFLDRHGRAKAW